MCKEAKRKSTETPLTPKRAPVEIIKALALFESTKLSFGDAMIAASLLERQGKVLYSFDTDFDKIDGITRLEPDMETS